MKGRTEVRFEQRWLDYCQVLHDGTPSVIGSSNPRPPDRREAIEARFGREPRDWRELDAALDEVWAEDAPRWRRRLQKFLKPLSTSAQRAFAALVEAGYQPDMLAFQFQQATQVRQYAADQKSIRTELDELDRLGDQAVEAVKRFFNRREQFDTYLLSRGLFVPEGEPGDAELKMLMWDLGDLAARHRAENSHMRRQVDARRNPLAGHAEVRLSNRVRRATGSFHDSRVELILEEIRQRMGFAGRAPGTLKKRRQRWNRQLTRGAAGALK